MLGEVGPPLPLGGVMEAFLLPLSRPGIGAGMTQGDLQEWASLEEDWGSCQLASHHPHRHEAHGQGLAWKWMGEWVALSRRSPVQQMDSTIVWEAVVSDTGCMNPCGEQDPSVVPDRGWDQAMLLSERITGILALTLMDHRVEAATTEAARVGRVGVGGPILGRWECPLAKSAPSSASQWDARRPSPAGSSTLKLARRMSRPFLEICLLGPVVGEEGVGGVAFKLQLTQSDNPVPVILATSPSELLNYIICGFVGLPHAGMHVGYRRLVGWD